VLALAFAGVVAMAAAGGVGYVVGRNASDPGAQPGSASEGAQAPQDPRTPVSEDAHWFQSDDYLVSRKPYEDGKLTRLRVAKVLGPPPGRGERGVFLDASSKQLETVHYWRTRVARTEDLVVGALVFCMARSSDRTAAAPQAKQQARDSEWILARVTEIADVHRGTVSVGTVTCAVDGVRVVAE
jgi:hypothetical protein